MKIYENLEHTADLKIRAFGKTKEEVFSNMALGMFENITEPNLILKDKAAQVELKVKAATYNDLKLEEDQEGNWVAEVVFDI